MQSCFDKSPEFSSCIDVTTNGGANIEVADGEALCWAIEMPPV